MKTILISGGAGYIGTELTQQLLKIYKVIVYDKLYFPWIYKNRKKIKFNKNLSFIKKNISEVRIKDFKDVNIVCDLNGISNDPSSEINSSHTWKVNYYSRLKFAKFAKKAGVTSVVVTHEMNSAFVIADRMAMLDKGRMIMVDTREAFEEIRDWPIDRLDELDTQKQLIRQFLRGDAEGPLTERKEASSYAEDLLGVSAPRLAHGPSVQSSKE